MKTGTWLLIIALLVAAVVYLWRDGKAERATREQKIAEEVAKKTRLIADSVRTEMGEVIARSELAIDSLNGEIKKKDERIATLQQREKDIARARDRELERVAKMGLQEVVDTTLVRLKLSPPAIALAPGGALFVDTATRTNLSSLIQGQSALELLPVKDGQISDLNAKFTDAKQQTHEVRDQLFATRKTFAADSTALRAEIDSKVKALNAEKANVGKKTRKWFLRGVLVGAVAGFFLVRS